MLHRLITGLLSLSALSMLGDEDAMPSHTAELRSDLSDEALMVLAAERDQASFEVLYHRHAPRCLGLSLRIVGAPDLAEDAVQLAFLAAWRDADQYRPARGSVRSWLLNITHHNAVDLVRMQDQTRRRRALESTLAPAVTSKPQPDELAVIQDDNQRALDALSALTKPLLETVMLCYYGGYSQREVARQLGVPLGTVKSQCLTALKTLGAALVVPEQAPPIPVAARSADTGCVPTT